MILTIKHYSIILSALLIAYLHFSLYPDFSFTLNDVAYIALLEAYLLPIPFFNDREIQTILWRGLVVNTNAAILLWVFIGYMRFVPGIHSATGYYAKTAEVVLFAFQKRK